MCVSCPTGTDQMLEVLNVCKLSGSLRGRGGLFVSINNEEKECSFKQIKSILTRTSQC